MNIFVITSLLLSSCLRQPTFLSNSTSFSSFMVSFNHYLKEKGLDEFNTFETEFSRTITDLNGNEHLYLDFYGTNGFIVIREDNTVVLFDTKSDIPLLREQNYVFFNDYNFYIKSNELNDGINNGRDGFLPLRDFTPGSIAYNYAYPYEYGDINSLMTSKYSLYPGLQVVNSGKLSYLDSGANSNGYLQYDESVYKQVINNISYSEGNCGIVSISNAISCFSLSGLYNTMPSSSSCTNITPLVDEPSYASTVSNYGYVPKSSTVSIHTILNDVRKNAIDIGYVCLGMNDSETEYAFETTISDYGYVGSFVPSDDNNHFFSTAKIKYEIDNGRPLQLRVTNDMCYGNHGMTITGYRYYKQDDWIQIGNHNNGFLVHVEYGLPFVSIYDGWSNTERWFDLSILSNLGSDYARSFSQSVAVLTVEETIS